MKRKRKLSPFKDWLHNRARRRYGTKEDFMLDAWKAGRRYEKEYQISNCFSP